MRPALLQTDTLNQVTWDGHSPAPHVETFQLFLAHPTEARSLALFFRLCIGPGQAFAEVEALLVQAGEPTRHACERWPIGRVQSDPERAGIGVGECALVHNGSHGLLRADRFALAWDLVLADKASGYGAVPGGCMGGALLPRLLTPHPNSRALRGMLEIWEGQGRHAPHRRLNLQDWHGVQTHWIDRRPASPFAWVHASQFDQAPDQHVNFELFAGPFRLGPLLRPSGQIARLMLGSTTYRLDGWRNLFGRPATASAQGWDFDLHGRGIRIRGSVKPSASGPLPLPRPAPQEGGGQPEVAMLAGLELIIEPRRGLPQTLASSRAFYVRQAPLVAPRTAP